MGGRNHSNVAFNLAGDFPEIGSKDQVVVELLRRSREWECLSAIRSARAELLRGVVGNASSAAAPLSDEELAELRSERAFQIAEFYYLIEESDQARPDKMEKFLLVHNEDMERLSSNKERCRLLGLAQQKVKGAIFTRAQVNTVLYHLETSKNENGRTVYRARFDQSSLGKLLIQVMSPEKCRLTVVALAKAGLLNRISLQTSTIIASTGLLEALYRRHLTRIVGAIAPQQADHMDTEGGRL